MLDAKREPEKQDSRWIVIKYRLTLALVVAMLLILVFMMVDGAVMNFQCSFWDFITFKCNRWDAAFKPWQ
jgi:hypothetical protein